MARLWLTTVTTTVDAITTVSDFGIRRRVAGRTECQSKVREYAKSKDLRVSDDFVTALSDEVRNLIDKAASRAAANDRKTLQKQDV